MNNMFILVLGGIGIYPVCFVYNSRRNYKQSQR